MSSGNSYHCIPIGTLQVLAVSLIAMRLSLKFPVLRLILLFAICCGLIGELRIVAAIKHPSHGVIVFPIVKMEHTLVHRGCSDDRTLVVQIVKPGSVKINETGPMTWTEARARLKLIFAARSEKILFFAAVKDMPFEGYISIVADAKADISGLSAVMLTPQSNDEFINHTGYSFKGNPCFN